MLHFAVIGCPISHSLSPEIYAPLFEKHGVDADFRRLLVVPAELPRLRVLTEGLSGFAVTMPHKRAIIRYLDGLSETASACGAVNIVAAENGRLIGHNTDGGGLADSLSDSGFRFPGSRAVILGRGGAALSAAHALKERGAAVTLLVRDLRGGHSFPEALIDEASQLPPADILINASPLGMKGAGEFPIRLLDALRPDAVFDMVYRRGGDTALIAEAKLRGLIALPGGAMLKAQALRAFKIWFGIDP